MKILLLCWLVLLSCVAVDAAEQITGEQRHSFKTAEAVCIVVDQSYGNAKGVDLPLSEIAQEFLAGTTLRIESSATSSACLTIKIVARGSALSESYSYGSASQGVTVYSGASIDGSVSFVRASAACERPFHAKIEPPATVSVNPKRISAPSDAPFSALLLLPGSYPDVFGEMIGEVFGEQPLIPLLKDADHKIAHAAVVGLGKAKTPEATDALISLLQSDDRLFMREAAALSLGKSGDRRAFEPLELALKDTDGTLRSNAAEALGKLGDPRAVAALTAALNDLPEVKSNAIAALGQIGDVTCVEPLFALIRTTGGGAEAIWLDKAGEALNNIKDPRSVDVFIAALQDSDLVVQHHAAQSLGKLKDPRAVEPLIQMLKEGRYGVGHEFKLSLTEGADEEKESAARALGEIGDPRAVKALSAELLAVDIPLRQAAITALGQIGDLRGVVPLLDAMQRWGQPCGNNYCDTSGDVTRISAALEQITGQHLGTQLKKWRAWWKQAEKKQNQQNK